MISPGAFYIVKQQFNTGCLYHWKAPFTTGEDVVLPEGLVFQISSSVVEAATAVYTEPVPYEDWEIIFVPIDTRGARRYAGFSLGKVWSLTIQSTHAWLRRRSLIAAGIPCYLHAN